MAIGSLAVRVSSDTTQFNKGMKSAGDQAKQLGSEVGELGKKAAMMSAALAAAGAAIVANLTVKGLAAVDAQAKLARQLGGTIDGLRGLQIAGSDAGVESGALNSAIEKLNARLGEATRETGQAYETLQRLGLSAKELSQMDVDERMAAIADRMKLMGLSTQVAADELRNLGIRQGEVTNLMLQGGDAIRNARGEVDDLGLSLSQVDAAKVEAANDSFARIGLIMEGISQRLAIEVSPILNAVSSMFSDAAKEAGGFGEAVSDSFQFVVESTKFVINAVDGIKRAFSVVADGIIAAWNAMASMVAGHIENIVEMVDKIPGIDMSDTLESIRNFGTEATMVAGMAVDNIHETLMRPLEGNVFKEFVAQAREASQIAAEEGINLSDMLLGTPEEFIGRSEEMLELQQSQDELRLIRAKNAQEMMTAIDEQAAEDRKRIAEQEAQARESVTANMWNSLTSLMNSESKKLFNIGKVAAISQSLISTYQGASEALKLGWPLGPIAAAAITTAGLANVARIKSQSFSGGSAGGGTAPTAVINEVNTGTSGGSSSAQAQSSEVLVANLNVTGQVFDRKTVIGLAEQMAELSEDGVRFRVSA